MYGLTFLGSFTIYLFTCACLSLSAFPDLYGILIRSQHDVLRPIDVFIAVPLSTEGGAIWATGQLDRKTGKQSDRRQVRTSAAVSEKRSFNVSLILLLA